MGHIKVTVLPGGVVYHDADIIRPGESFEGEDSTAHRLVKLGVVELADRIDDKLDTDPLVAAINGLDKENPEFWTKSGKPQVSALENRVGLLVSAKDRDDAYTRFLNRYRE